MIHTLEYVAATARPRTQVRRPGPLVPVDERAAMIAEIDVVAEEIARSYARLPGPAQAAAIRLGSSLSALRRALVSTATYP